MKVIITFGQNHIHKINGIILDSNCVAVVDGGRERAFELFGSKFSMEYPKEKINDYDFMKWFPRGAIEI